MKINVIIKYHNHLYFQPSTFSRLLKKNKDTFVFNIRPEEVFILAGFSMAISTNFHFFYVIMNYSKNSGTVIK